MSLRIKVGSYTPNDPASFEAKLRSFLESEGKISEVQGRGLELIWPRHKSQPGSNPMKIAEALNAAPRPLSARKLLTRLTDMTEAEIRGALKRMIRDDEVRAIPKTAGRYQYFLYELTSIGYEAWEKRVEAFEHGKPVALEIWRVFKTRGWKRGSKVNQAETRKLMSGELDYQEFLAGWRTLVAAGRLTVQYNAEGTGKHLYFIA